MAERDNKSQLRHFRISRNELIRLQTFSRSLVPDVETTKWWFLNLPSDELRLPDYSDVKFSELLLPSSDKATFVKLLGLPLFPIKSLF